MADRIPLVQNGSIEEMPSGDAVAATSGGTSQTTYSTGDILYSSGSNTLAKLAAGTNGHYLTLSGGVPAWSAVSVDHGGLTGLTDDDHSQYALLAGRSGGQTLIGGDAASEDLTFESTSHATKGTIYLKDNTRFVMRATSDLTIAIYDTTDTIEQFSIVQKYTVPYVTEFYNQSTKIFTFTTTLVDYTVGISMNDQAIECDDSGGTARSAVYSGGTDTLTIGHTSFSDVSVPIDLNVTGQVTVLNDTDAASNLVATFQGNTRVTPADGDEAYFSFALDDSTGTLVEFARLTWEANDVTNTSKDGEFRLAVMSGNSLTDTLVINENGLVSPTLVTPDIGTPSAGTLTNCTGLPISTGVSGLAANVATFLATPSSANLAAAVTDETGSGLLVFATNPTLTTPDIGTPSAGTLTNCTGLPLTTGITGTLPIANGGTNATSYTTNIIPMFDGTRFVDSPLKKVAANVELSAGSFVVDNNQRYQAKDTGGTYHSLLFINGSDQVEMRAPSAGWKFANSSAFTIGTFSDAGTFLINNQTTTTGITKLEVKAGAGQSTNHLVALRNSSNTVVIDMYDDGDAAFAGTVSVGATSFPISETNFGYNAAYKVLQLGYDDTANRSLALNFDPSSISGSGFSGQGQILIPKSRSILAPNAGDTDWVGVLKHTGTYLYLGGSMSAGEVAGDGLVVDTSGNAGVGGSPGFKFEVFHATQDGIRLRAATTSARGDLLFADSDDFDVGGFQYDHSTNKLTTRTNGGDRTYLDSNGYFGIGNSPTAYCDMAASTTSAASARIRSGTAPTSPNSGDLWYDGTNLKFRDGVTTRTITWT